RVRGASLRGVVCLCCGPRIFGEVSALFVGSRPAHPRDEQPPPCPPAFSGDHVAEQPSIGERLAYCCGWFHFASSFFLKYSCKDSTGFARRSRPTVSRSRRRLPAVR